MRKLKFKWIQEHMEVAVICRDLFTFHSHITSSFLFFLLKQPHTTRLSHPQSNYTLLSNLISLLLSYSRLIYDFTPPHSIGVFFFLWLQLDFVFDMQLAISCFLVSSLLQLAICNSAILSAISCIIFSNLSSTRESLHTIR